MGGGVGRARQGLFRGEGCGGGARFSAQSAGPDSGLRPQTLPLHWAPRTSCMLVWGPSCVLPLDSAVTTLGWAGG